jgi:hypothetical protein
MWIRELPKDYLKKSSYCYHSLFLWKNKKIYVMDNHLSAAWCWMQRCRPNKIYNFIHIDRHYDLGSYINHKDLFQLENNPIISYNEFTNIKRINDETPLFRWDNYIRAVHKLNPNWFHTNIFITQKVGSKTESWGLSNININEVSLIDMEYTIAEYIKNAHENSSVFEDEDYKWPWIVNIDIDVFYSKNEPHTQLISDDYIRSVAKQLKKCMSRIHVLTIALSPDCLFGKHLNDKWHNAFHILRIFADEINDLQEFPFPNF